MLKLVGTRHISRRVGSGLWAGADNWVDIANPFGIPPRVDGRGALRGIRIQNMNTSGFQRSGLLSLRMTIDYGILIASGQLRIPSTDNARPGRGYYLNLGQWVLGADYREAPWFSGSGANCNCAMLVNSQRVPWHNNFRLQAAWSSSGTSLASGFHVDVWYEIKG